MDINTILPLLLLSNGRNNNMGMLLMLMLMGNTSNTGTTTNALSTILNPQSMMAALMPGLGILGKYFVGGVGAVLAGRLLQGFTGRKRQRYPRRTVVINRYPRRSYGYRRY